MRKTRLVIQPTRCLHAIGFLLLYMSCPIFGDWGLVQPESAAAQRANSLQRESAKMVLKDPPDSRVSEERDPFAWGRRTDLSGRNLLSSERRWLDVRNQRMSPEQREPLRDSTRNSPSRLFRGTRQNQQVLPRTETRRIDNSRRLSKQSAEGGYRLHLEEQLAPTSRRLVRGEVQSDSKSGMRIRDSTRQISKIQGNQRLLKNDRTSYNSEQRRNVRRTGERSHERVTRSLRRDNLRENPNEHDQRQTSSSMRVENSRYSQDNNRRSQERENRNSIEREQFRRRTTRSTAESREENRASERLERTSRTSTTVRERNEMRTGDRKSSPSVRQARESRVSNIEQRFKDAQRQENRRVVDGIENIEIPSRRTTKRRVRNDNENREERPSRRMNSSVKTRVSDSPITQDRSLHRNEKQPTLVRADLERVRQDSTHHRITIRQNTDRHERSPRESRSRNELTRMGQDDKRALENRNDRKMSVRRSDQDNLRRSTRSLSHQTSQRSEGRVDIRNIERERSEHRNDARSINQNLRSQDNKAGSNRQRRENSVKRMDDARFLKTVRSNSRNVREQREMDRRTIRRSIRENDYRKDRRLEVNTAPLNSRDIQEQRKNLVDRRAERQVIRENVHRREMRVEGKTNMEREIRDTIRSLPLVRNQRIALTLEKESVMRNSLNEIRVSSRKENNNNREMTKAVELSKDVRMGREMFSKKAYTQDSVDQLFQDNHDNWISYKKIAGNCLLGAIAYFVTTRNPKIAY